LLRRVAKPAGAGETNQRFTLLQCSAQLGVGYLGNIQTVAFHDTMQHRVAGVVALLGIGTKALKAWALSVLSQL